MASRPPLAPGVEAFDAFFRRADLDQDGRISGAEAVAFFKGSNLSQQVLAQIWTYADQNRSGFLGRPEFYNALRLVTVAQRGRELTPDIVKAALYGPAAAKIPAPQINAVTGPAAQMNSVPTPTSQVNSMLPISNQSGITRPPVSPNLGFRPTQTPPNLGLNQQNFPAQGINAARSPQGPNTPALLPAQGVGQGLPGTVNVGGPRLPTSNTVNISTDWIGGRSSGSSTPLTSQVSNRGISPSTNLDGFGLALPGSSSGAAPSTQTPPALTSSVPSKQQHPASSAQPTEKNAKALVVSGNGFSSDPLFGGDLFSTAPQAKPENSMANFSMNNLSNPPTSGTQTSIMQGQFNSAQNAASPSMGVGPVQGAQTFAKQTLQTITPNTTASSISNISTGSVSSASVQSQSPWPRITQSDIQKYTAVFVKVDRDRDGKITGEEARNLFLSWRLPREVLKQVWDLSDQDNDSMLSLKEFCTALYLMEKYREGRPLPAVLPNELRLDGTPPIATGQPSAAYGGSAWQPASGLPQQGMSAGRPPIVPTTGRSATSQTKSRLQADGDVEPVRQKSKVPVLEAHLVYQLSKEEQDALNSKLQDATDADKKVQDLEKEILDAKEKFEFYRAKMQELVFYKSKCDNRLNEITERAAADKREVESLAKKYEEKCRNLGDVASKLTIEEATFRDLQERKLELYKSIVKVGQGGTADGQLQDHANQIQSDLEELVKTLNERCKQYGLRAKPTSLVELPFGWQPGIQEGVADWDEDWDKFEDADFTIIKELTVEVEKVAVSATPKLAISSAEAPVDKASPDAPSPKADSNTEKPSHVVDQIAETEGPNAHSEDESAKSPAASPTKSALETQLQEHESSHSAPNDFSPRTKETQSDHAGAESTISSEKYPDEPSWGATFDAGDDTDSVWGFSSFSIKDPDHERNGHSFFGYGDSGLNPIKTGSPSAASVYGRDRGPFFDSVPSTPLFNSNSPRFSPRFNDGPDDHSFDSVSRFDSFNMHDSGLFPPLENTVTRLDPMKSTTDSGFFPSRDSFARFDSFRSTADSGIFPQQDSGLFPPHENTFTRLDSRRSTTDSGFFPSRDNFARFDSFRSTADSGIFPQQDSSASTVDDKHEFPSFTDADPFSARYGSIPFKASSDSHSPRRDSDSWSAF